MLLQGCLQHTLHALRSAVVGKRQKRSRCISRIKPLCGAAAYLSRTLIGNLLVEASFIVLLAPLVGLINGHGDKAGLEELNDGGIGKSRLTVEHTIVSRATQGMSVHGPDKNRLSFPGGSRLRVQH